MDDIEVFLIAAASAIIIAKQRRQREKKAVFFQIQILKISKVDPSTVKVNFYAIYKQMFFNNFYRMSATDFERLINLAGPRIERKNTTFRKCIPVKDRVKERFLATGDSHTSLGYLLKVSKQSISKIVPGVCQNINKVLKDQIKISRQYKYRVIFY